MRTIQKYVLDENKDVNLVEMPGGAIILQVREQNNRICLWAKVSTAAPTGALTVCVHRFLIMGTGRELKVNDADIPGYTCRELVYCGSAHLDGGSTVAHVHEIMVDPIGGY